MKVRGKVVKAVLKSSVGACLIELDLVNCSSKTFTSKHRVILESLIQIVVNSSTRMMGREIRHDKWLCIALITRHDTMD